jgi:hypothetical protein
LLGNVNENVEMEDIFKSTFGNESSHEISSNKSVRVVNVSTAKNLVVKVQCSHMATFINTPGRASLVGKTGLFIS